MLKGYYHSTNHCFISGSTGDPEHYWVGHWRVCKSLQHVCEQERQAEQQGLCPVHRSYAACKALRNGARTQRVSKAGKDSMHEGVWIWFIPSIPSHRKLLTIFLTYLAFSCILSLHILFSQPHPGLILFILTALHLPSAFHSCCFFLMRASLKTIRQPPPSTIVWRCKRNSDIQFRNN